MKMEDVSAGGGSSLGRVFFPGGLRVLAVDDDPVCLVLLRKLLHKCEYQVTTTGHALEALKLLREKTDEFDIVISDVNMPDMDGFKLLEHVEFEMDIPVIMLSGHSDKELVYKGVTHGAVDYLLKPVRMEELQNIWQHVVRKRKMGGKKSDSSSLNNKVERDGNGVVGGLASSESSDANGKSRRKRNDDEGGEDEDGDSDGRGENEEGGNQKKPRVVWSVDLHKKFVHAVNQLGYDKAVPKKILDLMNVDGLTRENVASHLQKYRLYLKRMSTDKAMGITYGSKDAASYLGIASSLDGFEEFRCLTTPGRLSTYQPGGLLGRLNSSSGLTLRGIASFGLLQVQPSNSQPLLNSSITMGQQVQQPSLLSTGQTSGLFSPSQNKPTFGLVSSIGGGVTSTSGNPMLLQHNHHSGGAFGAQSSGIAIPSLNRDSFDAGIQHGPLSPNLLDNSRLNNGSWENAIQLPKFPSNPLNEQFGQEPSLPVRDCMPSSSSQIANIDFDSASLGSPPAASEMAGQVGFIGNVIDSFTSPGLNNSFGGMNSIGSLDQVPFDHGMDQGRSFDGSSSAAGQLSAGVSPTGFEVDKSQNGFMIDSSSFDPLDDMMAAMIKRDHNDGLIIDGDFGLDAFQLGSCI